MVMLPFQSIFPEYQHQLAQQKWRAPFMLDIALRMGHSGNRNIRRFMYLEPRDSVPLFILKFSLNVALSLLLLYIYRKFLIYLKMFVTVSDGERFSYECAALY